ncbi:MAG: TldD/PmbA family protein [Nanoarchaeota archaeon]
MGIAEGPFKYKKIDGAYDSKWKNADPVDIVEASINKTLEFGAIRCSGLNETEYGKTYLVTSNDVEIEEEATSFHLSIRALYDKYASGHSTFTSRTFNKFDYLSAAEEAGTIAKDSLNSEPGKAGKYDVVFSPLAFSPILNSAGSSASIFSVESGLSFFNNLMNKKVAFDNFNFYDDATLNDGIGSSSFDAEGYPSQRTPIIENGVLKNFLHNTSTARRYKTKSTGNAGLISPDPRNLILEEGKYKKEELFENLKNGLWITNVWYTRFQNYASGDFSTIPRDGIFLINNGKIVKSIKGIRVSENILNLLKNVSMISNKAKDIVSWEAETPARLPYVLVKNVNISKPEKE